MISDLDVFRGILERSSTPKGKAGTSRRVWSSPGESGGAFKGRAGSSA